MPDARSRPPSQGRPAGKTLHITSAVGLEEPVGRVRARRNSLFTSTIVWVTSLVCLAFLLGALVQAWSNSQLMQTLQREQQKTQQMQRYHSDLQQQVSRYQDPYVIESEARQRLGYTRPGEHVIVVVGTTTQGQPSTSSHPTTPPPQNFWQSWWNLFFGKG